MPCQKGERLHKKDFFLPPSWAADTVSVEDDESFAFTSNGDEGSGGSSVGKNEGGLRSSCTS